MLERYFIRPATLDRIRASWLGDAIEQYATWLTEQDYAARNIFIRIPILTRFGEFTVSAQRTPSFLVDCVGASFRHERSERNTAALATED